MKQCGFIFFPVMGFLLIMMSLLMPLMHAEMALEKLNYRLHDYIENKTHLIQAVKEYSKNLDPIELKLCSTQSFCIKMIDQRSYRVQVTDLGIIPCLIFNQMEPVSTKHWLISMSSEHLPTYQIEYRIATPLSKNLCKMKPVLLTERYLSWRML